jgi:hypothetical protein
MGIVKMFVDISIKNFDANELHYSSSEILTFKENKKSDFNHEGLKKYLLDGNNLLSAKAIMNDYFPSTKADIFLSHSHSDEDDVIKLAIKLESIGLKVFVDSCIWGYADELLKEIDNEFCLNNDRKSYQYDLRNRTTSNIYMILNAALHKMISNTELLLFLQTNHSLQISEYVEDSTYLSSPWLFSELSFARLCERKPRRQVVIDGNLSYSLSIEDSAILEEVRKGAEFAHEFPRTQYELSSHTFKTWLNDFVPLGPIPSEMNEGLVLEHLDNLYRLSSVPERMLELPRFV